MKPNTHKWLLIAFVIVTALLGAGSYADLLPPQYVGIAAIITGALGLFKRLIVDVGDVLDDGVRNGSFKPEAEPRTGDGRRMPLPLVAGTLALLACMLSSCDSLTVSQKQDLGHGGKVAGLAAAELALFVAEMQLNATMDELARSQGDEPSVRLAKQLAAAAARQVLNEARLAVAEEKKKQAEERARLLKERARLAKEPVPDVQPKAEAKGEEPRAEGEEPCAAAMVPACLLLPVSDAAAGIAIPKYGERVAFALATAATP